MRQCERTAWAMRLASGGKLLYLKADYVRTGTVEAGTLRSTATVTITYK